MLEHKILNLINSVYKNKRFPTESDFIVDKHIINSIALKILKKIETNNVEIIDCPDCHYCYHIAISESKEVPLIPYNSKQRRIWIKKFGATYHQMYIAISRLERYAMFYWSKYKNFLFFETCKHSYTIPNKIWAPLFDLCNKALMEMNVTVLESSLLLKHYKINYEGKIMGFDKNPSLLKLLFSEELH